MGTPQKERALTFESDSLTHVCPSLLKRLGVFTSLALFGWWENEIFKVMLTGHVVLQF